MSDNTKNEQGWLNELISIAEHAQRALSTQDVLGIVVRGGLRLGFERARLWLLDSDGETLVGNCEENNYGLEGFVGFRMPLKESVYSQHVCETREPQFFAGRSQQGFLDRHFPGFQRPLGDWVSLTLWAGDTCVGMLALDNAHTPYNLRPAQRDLLRLFNRQIGAALERAHLYELEQQKTYELDWLRGMVHIAEAAQHPFSMAKLTPIIVAAREQLGFKRARLWKSEDSGLTMLGVLEGGNTGLENDFRGFKEQIAESPYWKKVVTSREPVVFDGRSEGAGYIDERFGKQGFLPPQGQWVEIPLWIDDQLWGVLTLDNAEQHGPLRSGQRELLRLFARQVGAALQRVQLYEQSEQHKRLLTAVKISEKLGTTVEIGETIRAILTELRKLFLETSLFILIYNQIENILEFTDESLEDFYIINIEKQRSRRHIPIDRRSIAGGVALDSQQTKQVCYKNAYDVYDDEYKDSYLMLIRETRSELCISLMTQEHRLIGVLALESPKKGRFTDEDVNLLHIISSQISLAIDRAERHTSLYMRAAIADRAAAALELAHETKRIVAYILDDADMILRCQYLADEDRKRVEEIKKDADALVKSINDVEAWSFRSLELITLDKWIEQTIEQIKAKLSSRANIQVITNSERRKVLIHPILLRRVLWHLIANAIRATAATSIVIVRTYVAREGGVEIQVEDNGPGIPYSIRRQIFKEPILTTSGGMGYGLMLVRVFVEDMGGRVYIQPDDAGNRTTFCIWLPTFERHREDRSISKT